MTCSTIWGLLDKYDDLRASHELLNTERILYISQIGADIQLYVRVSRGVGKRGGGGSGGRTTPPFGGQISYLLYNL